MSAAHCTHLKSLHKLALTFFLALPKMSPLILLYDTSALSNIPPPVTPDALVPTKFEPGLYF
jgi:hypothetical protein